MVNNIKIIEGVIQSITKDTIKINNYYIKFFDLKCLEGLKQGDEIEVSYKENTKDGKLYRNGVDVIKSKPKLTNVNSEIKPFNKLDSTVQNTCLMVARDIYIVKAQDIDLEKTKLSYLEIVKEVLEGLKFIQSY